MKGLILAAGYATRLYPLTENMPKPLLEVAGKSILDYIVEKMVKVDEIDEIIIVTNHKFYEHFLSWSEQADYTKKFTVVNDGTLSNEDRLGAIGDIEFVRNELNISDDLLVLAGDNLFDFELTDFVTYFYEKNTDCITAYYEDNEAQIRRAGVVSLDDSSRVLDFEEKPAEPKSPFAVPAFYLYKKETLPLFKEYLEAGYPADAPGNFIPYLIDNRSVHAYQFAGQRYDIGTIESYENVQRIFEERINNRE